MTDHRQCHGLQVSGQIADLVEHEVLPGIGIEPARFWAGLAGIVAEFSPRTRALLATRDRLQATIDDWHRAHPGPGYDAAAYKAFLQEIGYLLPEGEDFGISTANVDHEIAALAGPQLVVPVMNARYALNAANARWGSLYDALYGTDVIPEADGASRGGPYNPVRGARVIAFARNFLDSTVALGSASWRDVQSLRVQQGMLAIALIDGNSASLSDAEAFVGYRGEAAAPSACCCVIMACTSRSRSTPRARSVGMTPPASRTSCWSPRSP
jgi:malate synthase